MTVDSPLDPLESRLSQDIAGEDRSRLDILAFESRIPVGSKKEEVRT